MEHIGIDVHKNESQICRCTEDGEIVERRIATRRDRFAAVLGALPRARILIEASTESEWVARCLEEFGHEVIVAAPNFAPMYASRTRRVKTDRRDAQALSARTDRLSGWSGSTLAEFTNGADERVVSYGRYRGRSLDGVSAPIA